MPSEGYTILGKYGDVINILPLLSHRAKQQRKPVNLVISKQYADVVAGLDYINADVVDIFWQDLSEAIRYSKRKYDKTFVPQTFGRDVAIQHRYPSFQLDAWARCRAIELYGKLPLIIPRPVDAAQIVARHLGQRPCILVADKGESSPFDKIERLLERLHTEFGATHEIVRFSRIRLDRFTDFVALYDAAKVLIVTETAHLHLSKATKTPTFALVTDKPERWHGSTWSSNFSLHIRYSHYERRERELIEGIRNKL